MKRTIALAVGVALVASFLIAVIAVPASAGAGVFSITGCTDAGVRADDPIVMPHAKGRSHVHQFFGNKSTNADSTYNDMVVAGTSCPLSADTAGYWAPALLDPNGQPAKLKRATAYYRATSGSKGQPIRAFPRDLRIIAGSPEFETGTDMLGWGCDDQTYLPTIPDCSSSGKKFVKAHIIFPSCWDGVNNDSDDHRSHMAYPDGAKCPASHPVRVPRLSLHFTWAVTDGTGYSLASDMDEGTSAGHTLHADFWNTWNQGALEMLVNSCLNTGSSCLGMTDSNFKSRAGASIGAPTVP
ncbi:MAG: DUF1996 domain-containing protein [Actinomycetota bacterium]